MPLRPIGGRFDSISFLTNTFECYVLRKDFGFTVHLFCGRVSFDIYFFGSANASIKTLGNNKLQMQFYSLLVRELEHESNITVNIDQL